MNKWINFEPYLHDLLKRLFGKSYPLTEVAALGGTKAKIDARNCPHCGAFLHNVGHTPDQTCWDCKSTIYTTNSDGKRVIRVDRKKQKGCREYVLEKPLYNPITAWVLALSITLTLGFLTIFNIESGSDVIIFVTTTAETWLSGNTNDVLAQGIVSIIKLLMVLGTVIGYTILSRSHIDKSAIFAPVLIACMFIVESIILLPASNQYTTMLTGQYLALNPNEAALHFQDKIGGELDRLHANHEYERAIQLADRAITRFGEVVQDLQERRNTASTAKVDAWYEHVKNELMSHRNAWNTALHNLVNEALDYKPLILEQAVLQKVSQKTSPEGSLLIDLPKRYLAYLKAVDAQNTSSLIITRHCRTDPWNWITPENTARFQPVREYCLDQLNKM